MKIADIQAGLLTPPPVRTCRAAGQTAEQAEEVVVRVIGDNGLIGYGSAVPSATVTGETTGSILCAVRSYIRPALMGMSLDLDCNDWPNTMWQLHFCMVHNSSAKAAVSIALYDLRAKSQGKPLYQTLGYGRSSFETAMTIPPASTDEMVRNAAEAVERGFSSLKVQVGREEASVLERVAAIRAAVGPTVSLRVDTSPGWIDPEEAVRCIKAMEDRGLEPRLVEQPVDTFVNLNDMKYVTDQVDTPTLAAKEVTSITAAAKLSAEHIADYISISLMRVGGIWNAGSIAAMADRCRVGCMISCLPEGQVSMAAAAHFCAGDNSIPLADLSGPALCATPPLSGGPVFGPWVHMNDDPGLGIRDIPGIDWR